MSNLRYIAFAAAILATISLSAGVGLWYGHRSGVVTLVVTPRRFLPVMPGATQAFSSVAWWGDAHCTTVSTEGACWQSSPTAGFMTGNQFVATGSAPAYGWVQATYSGLATRVFVKVTSDGFWNPDADADGDGISDATEIASNDIPDKVTFLNVRCRVH